MATSYLPPEIAGYTPTTYAYPDTSNLPFNAPPDVKIEAGFPGVEPLTYNFASEQKTAYDQLKPFYQKLLDFAQGDVDLAKRVLEYTYASGMRQSKEEYEQAKAEQAITFPQENEQKLTEQNRRGIIESGFGQTERERLTKSQELRKQAIEQALSNRESKLEADKGFGLEEQDRGLESKAFDLERQRRQEASGMASDKYGVKSSIFGAQVAKASAEEQRKVQAAQNQSTSQLLGFSGGGSSGGVGYTGEQVRQMGMNPDTMVSTDGKYYL